MKIVQSFQPKKSIFSLTKNRWTPYTFHIIIIITKKISAPHKEHPLRRSGEQWYKETNNTTSGQIAIALLRCEKFKNQYESYFCPFLKLLCGMRKASTKVSLPSFFN